MTYTAKREEGGLVKIARNDEQRFEGDVKWEKGVLSRVTSCCTN